MVRYLGMFLIASICAACSTSPTTAVSTVAPSAGPVAHEPVASLPLAVAAAPEPGACTAAPADTDDCRCPDDILQSAAMSFLGKTAAEFDGQTMRAVEYDSDELMAEARASAGFRRLLQDADARPADGQLDRAEAQAVELAVYAVVEDRLTASR